MAKMKATIRNGRTTKSGQVFNANHNTRTETRNLEGHIDHDRTALNVNFKFFADGSIEKCGSFDSKAFELSQYEIYYGDGQRAKNDRYTKDGHSERCKTVAEVYQNPKTAPLETILQLGNMNSDMPRDERQKILTASAFELVDTLRQKWGKNLHLLDLSIHVDEVGSPHIHARMTFSANDRYGYAVPNQSKAFAEMGVTRPDITKAEGKYNSPLISFSNEIRTIFYDLCEKHGIEIDREVKAPSQKHREILEYKCEQLEKSVAELTAERNTLRDQNSISKTIQDSFKEPDRDIEAEIIPSKTSRGKVIEAEKVKISKSDFEWLKERSRLTIGIKTAFDKLQRHGKDLWEAVNRDKVISGLSQRLETAERINQQREITLRNLTQNLERANEQLHDQQEFMQRLGIWKRFCDFVREKFRERKEAELSLDRK
jgi:hypothetical protein